LGAFLFPTILLNAIKLMLCRYCEALYPNVNRTRLCGRRRAAIALAGRQTDKNFTLGVALAVLCADACYGENRAQD